MAGHSIFIGYRRDDTADVSGRIYDRLRVAFGEDAVFKDVDNLPVGVDFGTHILTILPRCRVFLAMIGPSWIELRNEHGVRRLDDPSDWVRIELEAAFKASLQVVPVLVNGAPMPREDALPSSLRQVARLNAAFVRRDPDFHKDMDKLVEALRKAQVTGEVVVETAPVQMVSGSAAAWKLIETSIDIEDFHEFERLFPGTPEIMLASRRRRILEAERAQKEQETERLLREQEQIARRRRDELARLGGPVCLAIEPLGVSWQAIADIVRRTFPNMSDANVGSAVDGAKIKLGRGAAEELQRDLQKVGARAIIWKE